MNIVLTGFMGTGKSATGRIVAGKLGWAFYDTDEMIEKETGLKVAQIFAGPGEAEFRRLETQAVRLLALLDRCVIATGGGVPLRGENMDELEKNGVVVYLAARPETVVGRLKGDAAVRPLLAAPDPLAAAEKLLAARRAAYSRCRHAIATDDLSPADVAEKVLALTGIR